VNPSTHKLNTQGFRTTDLNEKVAIACTGPATNTITHITVDNQVILALYMVHGTCQEVTTYVENKL